MKNQVDILEDLFKLDSGSKGVSVDFRSVKNRLVTRLTIGKCHSEFSVSWCEDEYQKVFDLKYKAALEDLKFILTNS